MPELNLELLKNRKKTSNRVRPYDFNIPIPKTNKPKNILDKEVNVLPKETVKKATTNVHPKVAPIPQKNDNLEKDVEKKNKKRDLFCIDLSDSEIKEFKSLSNDRINTLDSRTKSSIKLLLRNSAANEDSALKISYHAQILLDAINKNLYDGSTEVLFSYDDIESFGLRRKYIKSSYQELVSRGIIDVSQVIHEGKIKNKYRVLNKSE